jgi:SAM-dependent methyltransferase
LEVPLDDAGDAPSAAAHDAATGRYYDRLSRWTAWLAALGYGGGRATLTAHRALADPRDSGRPTFTRLHDVLADALSAPLGGRVLDAGCGLGGTMLDLAALGSATFVGVTLSERQAAVARRAIARAELDHRIEVRVGSYDAPPAGPFDGIVAIESLAHAPDPAATIATLAARLAPRGWLAVVDDMPRVEARGTSDLATFQAGWRLPVLLSVAELAAALERAGLELAAMQDLTGEVRPRTPARIAQLEALNRIVRCLTRSTGVRAVLDSYRGGLALERLYARGLMSYRLVVARKPS